MEECFPLAGEGLKEGWPKAWGWEGEEGAQVGAAEGPKKGG